MATISPSGGCTSSTSSRSSNNSSTTSTSSSSSGGNLPPKAQNVAHAHPGIEPAEAQRHRRTSRRVPQYVWRTVRERTYSSSWALENVLVPEHKHESVGTRETWVVSARPVPPTGAPPANATTLRTRDESLLVLAVAYFLVRRSFGANATVTRREYSAAGPVWHATVAHACIDLVESSHRDTHHQGRPRSMNVALTATWPDDSADEKPEAARHAPVNLANVRLIFWGTPEESRVSGDLIWITCLAKILNCHNRR